jgi:hypothetical protein
MSIKFTLSETPEQEVINRLIDIERLHVNATITEAVIYFRGKYKNLYKRDYIYSFVGSFCGLSAHRVRQIYGQAPKTKA